jgi:hypothetical protein
MVRLKSQSEAQKGARTHVEPKSAWLCSRAQIRC